MALSVDIEIPADPQTVWNELERIENHTTWMADAVQLTFVTEQRRGIGTEIVS